MNRRCCVSCRREMGPDHWTRQPTWGLIDYCDSCWLVKRQGAWTIYRCHLRQGSIVRGTTCEDCGATDHKLTGHHTNYNKPDEVVWLCEGTCHSRAHRRAVQVA